jgi:hypothetical protein
MRFGTRAESSGGAFGLAANMPDGAGMAAGPQV